MQALDDYDKRLLKLLQQNNLRSANELGILVNLSASAVQRRLVRLRADKIIEADISIVSPLAAGVGMTCIVDVVLNDGNSQAIDEFKKAMMSNPDVTHCYYVTGTYDFVLIVNLESMKSYEEFSKRWLMDNPNVKHFYTHVSIDTTKTGYGLPIN